MKRALLFLSLSCYCIMVWGQHFEFSAGIYRLPYEDGIDFTVHSDVYSHSPKGKYDLLTDASNPDVVAAANGWIRWIEESFDTTCHNGTTCCWEFNNFVIIEHPNGEWSNYTHMDAGSVSAAGRYLNEWVTAGTPLGTEGNIGCSTEDHIHFEVSRPFDPDTPFDTIGGFLNCLCSTGDNSAISDMLIPVISGVSPLGYYMSDGADLESGPMDDVCVANVNENAGLFTGNYRIHRATNSVQTVENATVLYRTGSTSTFRAGNYIRLQPGFHVEAGAKHLSIIRDCNEQN